MARLGDVVDEARLWIELAKCEDPSDFAGYLAKFCDEGLFSGLARQRIMEIAASGIA